MGRKSVGRNEERQHTFYVGAHPPRVSCLIPPFFHTFVSPHADVVVNCAVLGLECIPHDSVPFSRLGCRVIVSRETHFVFAWARSISVQLRRAYLCHTCLTLVCPVRRHEAVVVLEILCQVSIQAEINQWKVGSISSQSTPQAAQDAASVSSCPILAGYPAHVSVPALL